LLLARIIEHMFYSYKGWRNRSLGIRTNVSEHTERSRHSRGPEISSLTPKGPGNRQGLQEEKGWGRRESPSERWIVGQRRYRAVAGRSRATETRDESVGKRSMLRIARAVAPPINPSAAMNATAPGTRGAGKKAGPETGAA
jgi:hypothetical protein